MAKYIVKGVIKDIVIVVIGLVVIWGVIGVVFGTPNPFYVVASGSMIPELQVYDVLIVQGNAPIEEVEIGEIIVYKRPSDHERVIVHRVVSIMDDEPMTLRAKGDANSASIPGTDYPITADDYIGTVMYVIPQIGYITQALKPPVNYIIIVVIIGVMVTKHIFKKKASEASKPTLPSEDVTLHQDTEYTVEHLDVDATTKDKPLFPDTDDGASEHPNAGATEYSDTDTLEKGNEDKKP